VVNDAQEVRGKFSSAISQPIDLSFLLEKGNFLNHSSMLYRATEKNVILGFVGPYLDYRIHLNFVRIGELGFINAAYVVYRQGSQPSTVRTTPGFVRQLYFEALVLTLDDPVVSIALRRKALRHYWQGIVVECLYRRRMTSCSEWSRKIRSTYPDDSFSVLLSGGFLALLTLARLLLRRISVKVSGANLLGALHDR
jgi:hypothetical protein